MSFSSEFEIVWTVCVNLYVKRVDNINGSGTIIIIFSHKSIYTKTGLLY